ncbi:cytochrome c oxidase subunit II [Taibaiella lutea]|uniref:Cytochrome c oxidase subunit 2 n=1 Tax=Taibaiella lutea TaxID=2608001 RepID=A0A5M6CE73_9BACT|nr:cytochrome c oxidase subunit II [Taibaiella lutea]KAA5533347.1 cytochrome c oxidase subunit II [Taibaiella lutea]
MSGLIVTALVILVFIVIYQIAKASELATIIRGEENVKSQTNRLMAWLMVAFFVLGMIGIWKCHEALIGKMLPESASVQGDHYDSMLIVTLILTGFVFFVTQALLFWFIFRYQQTEHSKAFFYSHNNKLEVLWTTVPALALVVLVVIGLRNWFNVTDKAPEGSMLVQVMGKQFNWLIRYPGADGILGKTDFRLMDDATNVMGLDTNDIAAKDDIIVQNGELHIVKQHNVQLVINSRDVIHDVGLPHFRMKMDAVPGITTTMWFTPKFTTDEMKNKTGNPDFVYEISCDQMCGKGHYSMRGTVIVQTENEFKEWLSKQPAYYTGMLPAPPAAPAGAAPATADTTGAGAVTMAH